MYFIDGGSVNVAVDVDVDVDVVVEVAATLEERVLEVAVTVRVRTKTLIIFVEGLFGRCEMVRRRLSRLKFLENIRNKKAHFDLIRSNCTTYR